MQIPNLEELNKLRAEGMRPSVIISCVNNRKVLFLFKQEYNLWMFPQGKIENNTPTEEAVFKNLTLEMGIEFTKECEPEVILFGVDNIEFVPGKHANDSIVTDEGKEVEMKGKTYYFCAVARKSPEFDVNKTEYNDYFWLEYQPAKFLAKKIHQKGKNRITNIILDKLKEADLIN